VLNLLHSGCIIAAQYYWTVSGWGDVEKINIATDEYPISFLITGLVAALVQTAYAYRIYILSNRKVWMPGFIILLTLMQLGASFYCTIMAARAGLQSKFLPYFNAAYVWLYGESAADVLITASLIYLLQSVRDATSFKSTKSIANRLSILTFETNALTAVSCISSAILLDIRKDGWGPAVNFLSVKLFCISLLVTLNARTGMSSLASGVSGTTSIPKYSQYDNGSRHDHRGTNTNVTNAIEVRKEAVSVAYDRDTGIELEKVHPFADLKAHLEGDV